MRKNKTTHMMAGVLIIAFIAIFLVLTGRFIYIQATGEVNNVSLEEWAEEKRTSSYTLPAERGKILDKNGMILAYDRPTYRVYAVIDEAYTDEPENPRHVVDTDETAAQLAPYLEVEPGEIADALKKGLENGQFQVEFGSAGKQLSQSEKEAIEEEGIPGIYFDEEAMRFYPNGMFASHIIGFARETEMETEDGTVSEVAGVTGMERQMDEYLRGADGYISYQRDIYNTKLLDPNEIIKEPEDGNDVYLTLDQKIQTLVDEAMSTVEASYDPERMTAVVMHAKTGEILAMSSRPSYNPNNPANVENWYNDVISTPIEPGSTVKMFTWAAAIEEGVYNREETFQSGTYNVNEKIIPIRDVNDGEGWGTITYDEGFERSSNVAASKLVWEKIGTERFLDYLHAFDIDKPSGIDLPGEVTGEILYNWPREKLTTSFGQGSTVTPIQMVKAASAIANDGKMMTPYVISKIQDPSTGDVIEENEPEIAGEPISAETAEQVRGLLQGAVEEDHATGRQFQLQDYTIGGKTGTAQIPNPDGGGYLSGRENMIFSFLGMAPIEDPELVVFVSVQQPTLEAGEYGSRPVSFIVRNVVENSLHYLNIEPGEETVPEIERKQVPELVGTSTDETAQKLSDEGFRVTTIGSGSSITDANVEAGERILPTQHIVLLTDEPAMPDVTGWSKREIVQLAEILDLKLETFGNGFTVMQSIEPGTPLQEGAYLGVELLPPGEEYEETINDEPEDRE
jgi:penicillin-binding protein 2B